MRPATDEGSPMGPRGGGIARHDSIGSMARAVKTSRNAYSDVLPLDSFLCPLSDTTTDAFVALTQRPRPVLNHEGNRTSLCSGLDGSDDKLTVPSRADASHCCCLCAFVVQRLRYPELLRRLDNFDCHSSVPSVVSWYLELRRTRSQQ